MRGERNEWSGKDYRGAEGIARTTAEGDEIKVMSMTGVQVVLWQASFSLGTPAAVIEAAYEAACVQADAPRSW